MDEKYLILFNTITDTISQLEAIKEQLVAVQQETEEIYISSGN